MLWYVKNEGSSEFFEIIMPYINGQVFPDRFINNFNYYGFDNNDSDWKKGFNAVDNPEDFKTQPILLTEKECIELINNGKLQIKRKPVNKKSSLKDKITSSDIFTEEEKKFLIDKI